MQYLELMTSENIALAMAVLFGISEALSLIPSVKSNGVFQLISNILRRLTPKK